MNKLKAQFESAFQELIASGRVELLQHHYDAQAFGNEIVVFTYEGITAQLLRDRGSVECDFYLDPARRRHVPLHLAMPKYETFALTEDSILNVRKFFDVNHEKLAKDIAVASRGEMPFRLKGIVFEDNVDDIVGRIRASMQKKV